MDRFEPSKAECRGKIVPEFLLLHASASWAEIMADRDLSQFCQSRQNKRDSSASETYLGGTGDVLKV
jgi:hypothetical protein